MGALSITGKSMGSTSLVLQAGTVTKTIPVSVKSRNLLSYGPASDNGLTATVNSDGSLHITGTASKQWAGVAWTFPCPVQGNVTLRTPTSITGLSVNVKFLDAKGNLLGSQLVSGKSAAVPANTVSLRFEILSSEATPTLKNGDIRAQLESGDTAHDWMKPDNTSLRGGGYELANLYPRVTGLPKTLGANPGITVTETPPGTYRFKGSTKTEASSWTNLSSSVHLDAGTYTMEGTDWPLGSTSWLFGVQATLTPDDGSGRIGVFRPSHYGPEPVKAGLLECYIFINTTGEVDMTLTPRLYKID